MTDEQIKHMVNRFLTWRLPEDFAPDGGITAKRPNYGPGVEWTPVGTNLLTAAQAEAMVRYMLEGMPHVGSPTSDQERARAEEALRVKIAALIVAAELPKEAAVDVKEALDAALAATRREAERAGYERCKEDAAKVAFNTADDTDIPSWDLAIKERRQLWACACGRILSRIRALKGETDHVS